MLTRTSIPRAEARLYSHLRQLLTRPGVLRGSLVETRLKCGKSSCRCHKDKRRRHPAVYLGLKTNGKQQMIYVPMAWATRVRDWIEHYRRIRKVLEELCQACLARLKERQD